MDLKETAREMDSLNMRVLVNLSGRSGEALKAMVDAARQQAPGRFVVFANLDFDGIDEPGWTERTVQQLQKDYNIYMASNVNKQYQFLSRKLRIFLLS